MVYCTNCHISIHMSREMYVLCIIVYMVKLRAQQHQHREWCVKCIYIYVLMTFHGILNHTPYIIHHTPYTIDHTSCIILHSLCATVYKSRSLQCTYYSNIYHTNTNAISNTIQNVSGLSLVYILWTYFDYACRNYFT